jgi:hypothetical protein
VGDDANNRGGDDDAGSSHYNESSGITPPPRLLPSSSPVGRTSRCSMPCVLPLAPVGIVDPPSPERRTTCPSLLLLSYLLSACAFGLSFASRLLQWLVVASPFVASRVACRADISRPLNTLLHCRCWSCRPLPLPLC